MNDTKPGLWFDNGRTRQAIALGVDRPLELPPEPPHPRIFDVRAVIGGKGYGGIPGTSQDVRVKVSGAPVRMGVTGSAEQLRDWQVTVDGTQVPMDSGTTVDLGPSAEITVSWRTQG